MSIDEGYIKYVSDWTPGPPPGTDAATLLDTWRRPLFAAGLIGHYTELGIGFGNLSIRSGDAFVISGTQTGHLERTTENHYAVVTSYDIAGNRVSSTGPMQASSEALTHAALYELDSAINAVVHVHSAELWRALRNDIATTPDDVGYGTPAMANAFADLYRNSAFARDGIAVMGGHEDGIVTIGSDLEQAARRVLSRVQPPSTA